jgi:hypothetical protein
MMFSAFLGRKCVLLQAIIGLTALMLLAGCDPDRLPTAPAPIDLVPNDVIIAWNTIAHDALMTHDEYANPLVATRIFTMVHLAQHDAINAVDRVYEAYSFTDPAGSGASADPVTAAAAAAHGVLSALFPEQYGVFDEHLNLALATASDSLAGARGVTLGYQAAAAILQLREDDGSDTPPVGDYEPGVGPGKYQPTPPFGFAFAPGWRDVMTFALTSAAQFRSPAPPALDSEVYADHFNEVRTVGVAASDVRTADQTAYAKFWYEFSDIGWNRIARNVAKARGLGLQSTARLFALLNMAMADAYIAGWDSKFHYDLWRPYTAIREADSDGNDGTYGDGEWEPLMPTPPVQDYPSTHSALGNAAAAVLASVFGDNVNFTFQSTSAEPALSSRSFSSFSQAADENAASRVMAGLHFRFACEAGQDLGRSIGEWTVENHLRKR